LACRIDASSLTKTAASWANQDAAIFFSLAACATLAGRVGLSMDITEQGMVMKGRRGVRLLGFAVLALASGSVLGLAAIGAATAQDKTAEEKPYTVTDGKVDKGTYNGYRRYTESCLRCHGPDAAGSSYAPALLDSVKSMTEDQFKEVVVNGRQNVTTSANNVMPPFGLVEDVMLYIDDIYGYLKARADGALGRGRPERIEQ
jgi:methanol metabolism-related c-type cytochrome